MVGSRVTLQGVYAMPTPVWILHKHQVMKDTGPALCADIPLESCNRDCVLCSFPIVDPDKKGIDKELGRHSALSKRDSRNCNFCNAKINGLTGQNVIDQVISDEHDDRLLQNAFATLFHFA